MVTESSEATTWGTAPVLPYVSNSQNLLNFLGIALWGTAAFSLVYGQHGAWRHWRDFAIIAFVLALLIYTILQVTFRRTTFEESQIVYVNTLGQASVHSYAEVLKFLPFNGKTKIWFADGSTIDLFKGEHDQTKVIRILADKCPQLHGPRSR